MNQTEEQTQDRIVSALYRIVQSIQRVTDLSTLLEKIMDESKDLLGTGASSLFLYDEIEDDLYFEVVIGEESAEIKAIRVPIGQGFVGLAASGRETIVVNDVATDTRHFTKMDDKSGFVTKNLIATPMSRNDKLIGVLEVLNKPEGYDELDVKILEIIAEHAAAAIENVRLIEANIKAERLAALGTTAAGLAHYIKNILTQLNGSASLIDVGLKTENFGLVNEAWPITKRATTKISGLVQDMLTISREREPERAPLSLNDLIGEILHDSEEVAKKFAVELKQDLDASMPLCQLDATRMHDSLLNLVGNAVEAIGEHDVQEGWVKVTSSLDADSEMITIVVEDNGPGMPPKVQKRLFEPFFSTKGSRGTGLGLAVVKKTMEEHGGDIALDSEVGRGSKFTVTLPLVRVEP